MLFPVTACKVCMGNDTECKLCGGKGMTLSYSSKASVIPPDINLSWIVPQEFRAAFVDDVYFQIKRSPLDVLTLQLMFIGDGHYPFWSVEGSCWSANLQDDQALDEVCTDLQEEDFTWRHITDPETRYVNRKLIVILVKGGYTLIRGVEVAGEHS